MLAEEFKAIDVGLEFLAGELKGSHAPSGIVFTVLAAMSGTEREYIRDHALEGHESARKRGKTIGGAGVTDEDMLSMALHLRDLEMSCATSPSDSSSPPARRKANTPHPPPSCGCCTNTTNRPPQQQARTRAGLRLVSGLGFRGRLGGHQPPPPYPALRVDSRCVIRSNSSVSGSLMFRPNSVRP
ncbi:recombinase family protein [Streptomyces oryzae]|uniref:recombinase family protein n=1 Tax=Streptomyces oryzae TaxID=1434886 RepID=UPI001FFE0701|nr:recombinase family protein [Streptomyces oryzae]